jgi:hypothetical protein
LAPALFFLLPSRLRFFVAVLFLLQSYSQPLLSDRLSFAFPLFCQPMPRRFPDGPALITLWSCHRLLLLAATFF